ncbi:acyl-CoA thioesterase [Campylobacter geochelonis]|uniref:Thioesterase superfamily protein n=1 Tax=Campylobacter geochelonis TaxID=1780362 RepID=A0A128EF08_9BACT|nr:thioesterase family protein [Campylobacter geochelonis]QKF71801.1 acyl-CoA thioesterase [Campylobacter geochelonis]CZE47495.1 thioesterase superfamily protein [Campylobacter geochelonis]
MRVFKMRVEFYDVDSMEVAWHGNYVKFIEAARCAFLREVGYTYDDMKKDGFAYPIVKMDFKFIHPAFFGDELDVEVALLECDTFLKFSYKIKNAQSGKLLCKATTSQVCVEIDGLKTCFILPEVARKRLEKERG